MIDLILQARAKNDLTQKTREDVSTDVRRPEDIIDWLIYIFHKLGRADFCVVVFALALAERVWMLLPLGAFVAQPYWVTNLFRRARGWHT